MSRLRKELQQTRPFQSLEQETQLNLLRTAGVLQAPFEQLFKEHQLSEPLYNVLRILRGQDGTGLACSHIGDRMLTRVPDITRLVDRLIKRDLAVRERSADDRRVVLISITKTGLALLAQLDEPLNALHKKSLGHLSAREMKELNKLLVKARKSS